MTRLHATLGALSLVAIGWAAAAHAQPAASAAASAPAASPSATAEATATPPAGSAAPAAAPPADPHAAANPHGANPHGAANPHARGMSGMYEPPPDTVRPDPNLPAGTLVVSIRDARDEPVAGTPIVLGVVRSSAAEGQSRDRREATTDALGGTQFEGLSTASGYSYTVRTTRGPATYELGPFVMENKAGVRATLHVFDAVTDIAEARVGMQSMVLLGLREDALVFDQMYRIYNLGEIAWQADVEVPLPAGFKAFTAGDAPGPLRMVGTDRGAALRGTVPPGVSEVTFRFQVPLEGTSAQDVSLSMLPRVAQARMIAEASKAMQLSADGFRAPERTKNREGKTILVTERAAQPGDAAGISTFTIHLTGLPTRAWGSWAALAATVLAVGSAGAYAWQRRAQRDVTPEAHDELVEAREALIGEIVALEKARARGEVGPRTYERIKAAMLDALARIMERLEAAAAHAAPTPASPAPARDRASSRGGARKRPRKDDT